MHGTVKSKDKPIWHVQHGSTTGMWRSNRARTRTLNSGMSSMDRMRREQLLQRIKETSGK